MKGPWKKSFLHEIDAGCQHGHYTKVVQSDSHGECIKEEKELMGHPFQCTTGNCESPLRLLRQAAVHHPVIRNLLGNIYTACASSNFIDKIDTGFCSGCIDGVKEAIKCDNLSDLLIKSVPDNESSEASSTPSCDEANEAALQVKYANTVCEYEKNSRMIPRLRVAHVNAY